MTALARKPRRTAALLLAGACLVLTACGVTMPSSGPVHVSSATGSDRGDGTVSIKPRSPAKGATPDEIVAGFLDAMTETPAITLTVAREFLTPEAAASWQPTGMVVYSTVTPKGNNGVNNGVEAKLADAHRIDVRGAWLGPLSDTESTVSFPMALEGGKEWRIAEPPPYLMVPQGWFEQRFQPASLYFFDPTSKILVPEPVYLPAGQQFASALVKALLQGPSIELASTEKTFVPDGLRSLVSVVVSSAGVAQVDLTSDAKTVSAPPPDQAELLVSQLAWTLGQDPRIDRFRVTIDGRPLQLPGETEFSHNHGHDYAPFVAGSSTQLFGLEDGRMVGGSAQNLAVVTGPFGQSDYGLRTVATDLHAEQAAGVSSDAPSGGDTLWVAPVKENGDQPRPVLQSGEDLLRPAWDFSGRLWDIDRQQTGAVVYFQRNRKMVRFHVPGVSGKDVKEFLISRDGSRLVAVIHDPAGNDSIVVSRLLANTDGQVVDASRAVPIVDGTELQGQVRDIAWRTPTSIAVLRPLTRQLYQVRSVSVDGANNFGSDPVTVDGDVRGLAGTPVPDSNIYAVVATEAADSGVVTSVALSDLAGPHDNMIAINPGVTQLSYVG